MRGMRTFRVRTNWNGGPETCIGFEMVDKNEQQTRAIVAVNIPVNPCLL